MAKRSRRVRRPEFDKQVPVAAAPVIPAPEEADVSNGISKNILLDFAEEYYYVYHDLRNVFIVSLLMLAVMVGLSFVI
jgi:hypothetical protein